MELDLDRSEAHGATTSAEELCGVQNRCTARNCHRPAGADREHVEA